MAKNFLNTKTRTELTVWLMENQEKIHGKMDRWQVRDWANKALGFDVSVHSIVDICKAMNVKLPPKSPTFGERLPLTRENLAKRLHALEGRVERALEDLEELKSFINK